MTESTANCKFNDKDWTVYKLTMKFGGLGGLRDVSSLRFSVFFFAVLDSNSDITFFSQLNFQNRWEEGRWVFFHPMVVSKITGFGYNLLASFGYLYIILTSKMLGPATKIWKNSETTKYSEILQTYLLLILKIFIKLILSIHRGKKAKSFFRELSIKIQNSGLHLSVDRGLA